jgi:hypothetical protein
MTAIPTTRMYLVKFGEVCIVNTSDVTFWQADNDARTAVAIKRNTPDMGVPVVSGEAVPWEPHEAPKAEQPALPTEPKKRGKKGGG